MVQVLFEQQVSAMACPLSLAEIRQWTLAMFDVPEMPKTVEREVIHWLLNRCKRYGDDGMGDKPADMSTTTYWLQHLGGDSDPHLWSRLMDAADLIKKAKESKAKEEPKPKRARLAKAKAAPKPAEGAPSSSSGH